MKPSDRVRSALAAGWYSACDGLAAVTWHRFQPDKRQGEYRTLTIRAGEREIQVSISPSGRSTRIYVDGRECADGR